MEIKKGHSILIGSDGIFDNYTHDELLELINNGVFDDTAHELRDSVVRSSKERINGVKMTSLLPNNTSFTCLIFFQTSIDILSIGFHDAMMQT